MSKEYIERDAFVNEKRKQYCADCDRRKGMKNGKIRFCYDIGEAPCRACYVDDVLVDVEDFPAADVVEVRHGRWIKTTKVHPDLLNDSTYNYRCSNCGYMDTHGANVEVPYCWHCGAKMDGGAE